jgi:hypothetical protein
MHSAKLLFVTDGGYTSLPTRKRRVSISFGFPINGNKISTKAEDKEAAGQSMTSQIVDTLLAEIF